ncbi:MAG: hypothetical protein KDJ36_02955 [Hyphomicrobiaceae bacterium]|nr:hypothetical protein [Hyphomicrobiaceae bacterium]
MLHYRDRVSASILTLALAICALVAQPDGASAGYRFGTDETLHAYAKTGLKSGNTALSLCYKVSTYNFIAPVYTSDEKVICDPASKKYWPMPTGNKLLQYQKVGLLPSPIPNYSRPWYDYVFGYLLWIILAGIGAFGAISAMFSKKKDEDGATEA